jgi:hypothetical protein
MLHATTRRKREKGKRVFFSSHATTCGLVFALKRHGVQREERAWGQVLLSSLHKLLALTIELCAPLLSLGISPELKEDLSSKCLGQLGFGFYSL